MYSSSGWDEETVLMSLDPRSFSETNRLTAPVPAAINSSRE